MATDELEKLKEKGLIPAFGSIVCRRKTKESHIMAARSTVYTKQECV